MTESYEHGYNDGFNQFGTRYPTSSEGAFDEYQRGYLDGTKAKLKADLYRRPKPDHRYVVKVSQRVIAETHHHVKVLASDDDEAIKRVLDGEHGEISTVYIDSVEEIYEQEAEVVDPFDPVWETELKDWA
jgi:hypothetical protein